MALPDVLFDGYSVLMALSDSQRARTSPENVSDTLDAVVRLLRAEATIAQPASGQKPDSDGWIEWNGGKCPVEANKALVAENERLKETQEMISFLQAGANDEAVIKAAICSTEQAEERINLSVRSCLNISTDQLRIAADARLDGLFKFKKRYEDQLTATRTALAAAESKLLDATCNFVSVMAVVDKNSDAFALAKQGHDELAQPSDDSALREMIAGVYEECEQACAGLKFLSDKPQHNEDDCIAAIRALAEKARHGN